MIPRYARPDMTAIWSLETKFRIWFEIEALAAEGMARIGAIIDRASLPAELQKAHIHVVPSRWDEPFGLVTLEGMACEVVPIATRTGGVPEVIEHGVSGFLADVGDVETMARYAIDLLSDESALRAMGKRARAAAQEKYCSSKIIPLYEGFYQKVLEQSSKSL